MRVSTNKISISVSYLAVMFTRFDMLTSNDFLPRITGFLNSIIGIQDPSKFPVSKQGISHTYKCSLS